MKRILIGTSVIGILAAVFGATPYYLGGKAQESLEIQHRALADTFYFDVVSRDYQRGWFSSTETTVIRVHPAILAKFNKQLPDNLKSLFHQPITVIHHVKHGLFADGLTPVRAVVDTELQYDAEVQKTLARFFGDKIPVRAHNVIALDGSGRLDVQIENFDYEELSGIKLNFQGMNTQVSYQPKFTQYTTRFDIPAFKAQLADQGSLNIENVSLTTQSRDGKNDITLGSSETKIGRLDISWNKNIAYDIHLNELVNMVTDLQIGAFINPYGSITPNKVSLQNLAYQTKTDEQNEQFINSQGIFSFDALQYGEEQYGPLTIDIAAEHLDAKALSALKHRWAQISTQTDTDSAAAQKLALDAVRNEGANLFIHNPVFKINRFDFKTPNGYVKVNGDIAFNGLTASDLNHFSAIVKKTKVDIGFDISQKVLESVAVTQMRSMFTVEDPNSAQEQQEISDTIRLIVGDTLKTMNAEGYLTQNNGAVQTRLVLNNNQISLNGKPFEVQSDEAAFAQLEAQAAQEAAQNIDSAAADTSMSAGHAASVP